MLGLVEFCKIPSGKNSPNKCLKKGETSHKRSSANFRPAASAPHKHVPPPPGTLGGYLRRQLRVAHLPCGRGHAVLIGHHQGHPRLYGGQRRMPLAHGSVPGRGNLKIGACEGSHPNAVRVPGEIIGTIVQTLWINARRWGLCGSAPSWTGFRPSDGGQSQPPDAQCGLYPLTIATHQRIALLARRLRGARASERYRAFSKTFQ